MIAKSPVSAAASLSTSNADIVLMRFLWVLAAILTFPLGIIAYIVAWIIMPEAPEVTAPSTAVAVTNR